MSHPLTFEVKWDYRCYFCQNPLDPYIVINCNQLFFFKRFYNFQFLKPCDMTHNISIYKIINLKCRRVCCWCFENDPHKVNPKDLMKRQTGERRIKPSSGSMNDSEIFQWFQSFYRYLNRPDADDYTVFDFMISSVRV